MAELGHGLKILRGSNGNNTTLVESIEIPPPRPKRKPSHPYPRKLVEILITEQPLRSQMFQSPKSSDFCQENKIPKSELSVIVSETFGSSDSDTPTGSFSPVSSYSGIITSSFPPVELKTSCEEDKSPPLDGLNGGTPYNKQPLVELAHFSKDNVCSKDDAREESSVCTFKLFGTTLLVTDTCKHSSPTLETIKPIPAMYLMQLQSGCSEIATIVPWWTLSHKEPAEGKYPYANLGECEDKEVQKEGSWAGSSSSSVHDGENNERSDDQTKSQVHYLVDHTTPSEVSAISEFRVRSKTCGKGFVPYKRCVAKRENQCSTVTDEKREEQ